MPEKIAPDSLLNICTPSASYPIMIGSGQLTCAGELLVPYIAGDKVFVVTDEDVAAHYLEPLKLSLLDSDKEIRQFILPAGEKTKSIATFEQLMLQMLEARPDRKTTILALGGGVIGDLAGFAASVMLRGVPYIQLPTSLLAQVDSSVGGKTAVNCRAGKNLIGTFYQPKAVIIDMETLQTLPQRQLLAGYGEILKYGLLGDVAFYERLLKQGEQMLKNDLRLLQPVIAHCCSMKAAIVNADEKEAGQRALLNLGHTFGHAIEAVAAYDGTVLHGEAVALGCLMALSLSHRLGYIERKEVKRFERHLRAVGLPVRLRDLAYTGSWKPAELSRYCYGDKKAEGGKTTFVILEAIGQASLVRDVDDSLITEIFTEFH